MIKKLKAGALQLTIFIVVVIALLLSGFLIYTYSYTHYRNQSFHIEETVENATKGIKYALSQDIPERDSIPINFNNEEYKKTTIYKTHWDIFEKVFALAQIKKNTIKKIALIGGAQPTEEERKAVHVEEHNKPLIVVGDTYIQGTAILPKQGVRPGNIAGHYYYGNQLIYGRQQQGGNFPNLSRCS